MEDRVPGRYQETGVFLVDGSLKDAIEQKEESPGLDPFPLWMDRKQCPRCIGDETLSLRERTFKHCRPAVRPFRQEARATAERGEADIVHRVSTALNYGPK